MMNDLQDDEILQHHLLRDDGRFPNNAKLPLLIYKSALRLPTDTEAAASEIERFFEYNNWKNTWRDGIYNFHHYHSIAHEVLGIYSGQAVVQFGGPKGIAADLRKGDVVIIPAGVSHKCLHSDESFRCVGAYPGGSDYDMNYGNPEERSRAVENINRVPLPDADPLYGETGPLFSYWKNDP